MDNTPKMHPDFWRGYLQLLYWVFFKPITLRRYADALVPQLSGEGLWKSGAGRIRLWREALREGLVLRRFLSQALWSTIVTAIILAPPITVLVLYTELN